MQLSKQVTSSFAAAELLEVVPRVMRVVRAEMRRHRASGLSVPEFRALGFLNRQPGASLGDVADHVGTTPPSMSKLIDGLVGRKLVTRQTAPNDRRRLTLTLTQRGRAIWEAARASTQTHLANLLSARSPAERVTIVRAMQALRPLFISEREKETRSREESNGSA
jgi:DNA-binding MarR family transcriptional regulator